MYRVRWRFRVRPGAERAFERIYGEDGDWVQLFRKAPGYLGSTLKILGQGVYVTVDRWKGAADFEDFKAKFSTEYEALDRQGASLTLEEAPEG